MADVRRGLILIDTLNDFLSPKGKLHDMVKESLATTGAVDNMHKVTVGARTAGISIFYGLHQHAVKGVAFEGWNHMRAIHKMGKESAAFTGWGGEVTDGFEPDYANGDVVVARHWNSSAFKGTDLDYQLRQHDITHVVLAGLTANTCIESTGRDAVELGYHVTLITDATAGFSNAMTEAATKLIWPVIADEVLSTENWVASLDKTTSS